MEGFIMKYVELRKIILAALMVAMSAGNIAAINGDNNKEGSEQKTSWFGSAIGTTKNAALHATGAVVNATKAVASATGKLLSSPEIPDQADPFLKNKLSTDHEQNTNLQALILHPTESNEKVRTAVLNAQMQHEKEKDTLNLVNIIEKVLEKSAKKNEQIKQKEALLGGNSSTPTPTPVAIPVVTPAVTPVVTPVVTPQPAPQPQVNKSWKDKVPACIKNRKKVTQIGGASALAIPAIAAVAYLPYKAFKNQEISIDGLKTDSKVFAKVIAAFAQILHPTNAVIRAQGWTTLKQHKLIAGTLLLEAAALTTATAGLGYEVITKK